MIDRSSAPMALHLDSAALKGKVVVIDFWATWCAPCMQEMPDIEAYKKRLAGRKDVTLLSVNVTEEADDVRAFVKKRGVTVPVVLDPEGRTADLFGVELTTTTMVIDGEGVLRYCGQFRKRGGGSAEDALKAVLDGKEVAVKTTPHSG